MNIKISILAVFFILGCISLQAQSEPVMSEKPIEKIKTLNATEIKVEHTDQYQVPDPSLPYPATAEDSVMYNSQKVTIDRNYVRFNKSEIARIFPQAVTVGADQEIEIDYTSFIPIMLEAIKEQQDIIEELKARISELESANK